MLPLPAFTTKSCPGQYAVDEVDQGSLTQMCVRVTDDSGCPVDVLKKVYPAACPPQQGSSSSSSSSSSNSSSSAGIPSSSSSSSGVGGDLPAGWSAVYRIRQMQTSSNVLSYLMSVVSAADGIFTVTLPPEVINVPGVMLSEVGIYDDQNRRRLTDPRYLKIRPTLETQNYRPVMPADVRMALWDYCPAANTLLDDYEFSEDMIIHMIRRPLDLWNELLPPVHQATPSNFPWREHWLRCTCGYLLIAAGRLGRRNHMSYTAGGMSIDDNSTWPKYQEEGKGLLAEFKDWARNKKIEINISGGYGTVRSNYGRARPYYY